MPTPASPSNPKLPGDSPQGGTKPAGAENPVHSPIDEPLLAFWKKNGQAILVLVGLVILFYVGKGGWDYFARQQEEGIRKEFAEATTPDKLQAFSAAHPDHILGGIAQLVIADGDSKAGRALAAVSGYSRAFTILKSGPLAARAQLGLAMAKIQSGEKSEGEASLHALADDAHQFQAVRAEALFQLASLAASAGNGEEVQRLAMQLMQIDPSSPWAQEAFALEAEMPPSAPRAPMVAPAKPAFSLKPGGP
jgi:predicted negative regulator of RcsB-dependent stress response